MLINTLFDLCRIIHDSVDCLSPSTEIHNIATLLNSFVDKINFGKDLEQQLNFYVDCRGAFCNIDLIKDRLISSVGELHFCLCCGGFLYAVFAANFFHPLGMVLY